MTDSEQYSFRIDYAKTNRSSCKKCKAKIDKGVVRIAKLKANPFSDDGGLMTEWHHPKCVFETFLRARATTKKIETTNDLEHFDNLKAEEQEIIKDLIRDYLANRPSSKTPKKQETLTKQQTFTKQPTLTKQQTLTKPASLTSNGSDSDMLFQVVITLCHKLQKEPSYNAKTDIIRAYLTAHPTTPENTFLLLKLMIPSIDKRVYNVKDKQLVKILSCVLYVKQEDMSDHLEAGDVGETSKCFYIRSSLNKPTYSNITIKQVDDVLQKLCGITKEDEQIQHFKSFIKLCTPEDLKYILYLIKKDLRINAREKHILQGLHPSAYQAFQMSHDLKDVVNRFSSGGSTLSSDVELQLMTPVRPMLAEACKSVAQALAKCPQGMYSEIKYDGERVQLHKRGTEFQFFSRSLKPVLPHKVQQVQDFIPEAFPHGHSMILDCEVLLVDVTTGKPLPFGTLGIHKKSAFKSASVCLFVFDILYLNGEILVNKPIRKRRKILNNSMTEIPNRVMFSEMKLVKTASELAGMISHVLREGLEGLVLKGLNTIYEPGKRHWLKVKKDYLQGGAMADSADLVVLGGYLGTGNKGGMCSVYLMGTYCPRTNSWKTVCKVGNGHDDVTLHKISKHMISSARKIKGDYAAKPSWLDINKGLVPDYIVTDPKDSAVWEITGAEFSQSTVHTAGGISIRFPRVTKIRDDKDWKTATNLPRLQHLARTSQEKADLAIQKLMIQEGGGKIAQPASPGPSKQSDKAAVKRKSASNNPTKSPAVDQPAKKIKLEPSPWLADVFTGTRVYISRNIPHRSLLARYVVAFNGEIVTDKYTADKMIVNKTDITDNTDDQVLSYDWLLRCIRDKKLA